MGNLESLLSRYCGESIKTSVAGRTDTGVHAQGQVLAFRSDQLLELEKLTHGINSMARAPLAVLETAALDDESSFHPRHSAVSRTYQYLLVDQCCYSQRLFWRGRAWTVGSQLDLTAMRDASSIFLGRHDFSSYSYNPDEDMARTRNVTDLTIEEEPLPSAFSSSHGGWRLLRLEITANGFLRRMVRALTSELVRVGCGLEDSQNLIQKLAARDPELGPPPAPAHGLYFKAVSYSPDPFEMGRQTGRYYRAQPSHSLNFQDRTGRLN